MKSLVIFAFFYLAVQLSLAQDEAPPHTAPDHKFMGEHPMVLIGNGSNIYASLLPTYKEPHNFQLIYAVDNKNLPLQELINDADLVTVKPQPYNLEHLIRGEKLKIIVDVYMGHFSKGGQLTYQNMALELEQQLYVRKLEELDKSHIRHKYDSAALKNNQRLLIHQIQTAPSYDHIILLLDDVNCLTEFATATAVPKPNEVYRKLAFCGSIKPLYYEYQDFRQ